MKAGLLDQLNLLQMGFRSRWRERLRWRKTASKGNPRVFYGFDRLPSVHDPVSGGMAKLIDLKSSFPNSTRNANIVYLVSSTLPIQAVYMASCAKNAGARVVLNQDGVAYPAWHGPGWRQINKPLAALNRIADHVFYQSRFAQRSANRFLGKRRGSSEVLFNSVDTNYFVPKSSWPMNIPKYILLAGSHHAPERIRSALVALQILNRSGFSIKMTIAGRLAWHRDEQKASLELQKWLGELNLQKHVNYIGVYSRCQARAIFRGCDFLLHTQYNDVCPTVLLEAMACGLPIIYSASGGVPELVGSQAGEGISVKEDWEKMQWPSGNQLVEATRRLILRFDEAARAARLRAVRNFDVQYWIKRHASVFQELVR